MYKSTYTVKCHCINELRILLSNSPKPNTIASMHFKGVSRAYKLWGDLRPRGQSLDRKILLQNCIDEALASFIAKILLDPRLKTSKKCCSLTIEF